MNEGHIDGRIVRGIVSEILRQSGERFLAMKQQLSEKDEQLAEKDNLLSEKDEALSKRDLRIEALEKELARYKKFYGNTALS